MKMGVELVVILKLLEKTCISQLSWNNAYIDTHLPTHFDTNTYGYNIKSLNNWMKLNTFFNKPNKMTTTQLPNPTQSL